MRRKLIALLALLPTWASADVFLQGDVEITTGEYGEYQMLVTAPAAGLTSGPVTLPEGCQMVREQRYDSGRNVSMAFDFACETHLTAGDAIQLPLRLDAATILTRETSGTTRRVLTGADPLVFEMQAPTMVQRSWLEAAADYFREGILHIAEGWDHLAFVLCLCLLVRRWRRLLLMITAFTIGHSVSMALSFFDVVTVSMAPTEAVIALTIVWMAREAMLNNGEQNNENAGVTHLIVVGAFGLLHGLGFASALKSLGVVATERAIALAFFNLGVEAGQILFVGLVLTSLALIRLPAAKRVVSTAALVVIGSAGSFWTIERLATLS